MKINKEENVEKFLEVVDQMIEIDPDIEKKLRKRKHVVGSSL